MINWLTKTMHKSPFPKESIIIQIPFLMKNRYLQNLQINFSNFILSIQIFDYQFAIPFVYRFRSKLARSPPLNITFKAMPFIYFKLQNNDHYLTECYNKSQKLKVNLQKATSQIFLSPHLLLQSQMKSNESLSNEVVEQADQRSKSSEKTDKKLVQSKEQSFNNEKSICKAFWLTDAQKMIIQHRLPKLFSLIPISQASSRLALGSKILLQQSVQFQNRKRGRPDGSTKRLMPISPFNQKKSARIKQKKDRLNRQCFNQSQKQSSDEESDQNSAVSLEKQLDCSVSVSKCEIKSKKSKSSMLNLMRRQQSKESISEKQGKQYSTPRKKSVKNERQQQNEDKRSPLKIISRKQQGKQCKMLATSDESKKKTQNQEEFKYELKDYKESISIKQIKVIQQSNCDKVALTYDPSIKGNQKLHQQEISLIKPLQQKLTQQQKSKQDEQIQSKIIQQNFKTERQILRRLKAHQNILPFLQPVDEQKDGAPHYYSIITDPIDLKTIEFKLSTSIYREPKEFHLDIQRMWTNARQYNNDNPFMQRVTNNLEKYYQRLAEPARQEAKRKVLITKKSTKLSQ